MDFYDVIWSDLIAAEVASQSRGAVPREFAYDRAVKYLAMIGKIGQDLRRMSVKGIADNISLAYYDQGSMSSAQFDIMDSWDQAGQNIWPAEDEMNEILEEYGFSPVD